MTLPEQLRGRRRYICVPRTCRAPSRPSLRHQKPCLKHATLPNSIIHDGAISSCWGAAGSGAFLEGLSTVPYLVNVFRTSFQIRPADEKTIDYGRRAAESK